MTAENWILERALAAPKPRLEQKTDHDLKPQLDQPVLWLAHLHPLAMDHARTLRKALTMLADPRDYVTALDLSVRINFDQAQRLLRR